MTHQTTMPLGLLPLPSPALPLPSGYAAALKEGQASILLRQGYGGQEHPASVALPLYAGTRASSTTFRSRRSAPIRGGTAFLSLNVSKILSNNMSVNQKKERI